MRFSPRICVLLGIVVALAPFFIAGVAPGCGGTANATCDSVYDPNRVGPDGELDPCCQRSLGPCVCAPGFGDCKDAGAGKDAASDADGGPPPTDAATDADAAVDADSGPACPGACVPLPGLWFGPVLLWKGSAGSTVDCPAGASEVAYTGFTDLNDAGAATCGACGCELAPDNNCGPPEHITASNAGCSGPAGFPAPFDPPPGWDGGCSAFDDIGTGAKSLISGPLTLTESCVADAGGPDAATTPARFGSSVVACAEKVTSSACDENHLCASTAPNFQTCVYQPADVPACPPSYPQRISVAEGFDDQRACAPCACVVAPGACTATLTVYGDSACSTFLFARALNNTMTAQCDDVPAPGALGSKTLTSVKYAHGSCAPTGGEPTDGGVVATEIATFCCLVAQ